jgi:hypothetical protein
MRFAGYLAAASAQHSCMSVSSRPNLSLNPDASLAALRASARPRRNFALKFADPNVRPRPNYSFKRTTGLRYHLVAASSGRLTQALGSTPQ